jgi:hypothetical protein
MVQRDEGLVSSATESQSETHKELLPKQKKRPPRSAGALTPRQQLRQRRIRMLTDQYRERKEQEHMHHEKRRGTQEEYMTKLYIVVATAVVVTVVALLNYTRPAFLFRHKKAPPPVYMATLYPPTVIMDRDLPRFFRTYSIATPDNEHARKATIKVIRSRRALNHGTGNLKVILKAWDEYAIGQMMERNICGLDFEVAYRSSTLERQNDLVTWCLLTTRITEGFFLDSVEVMSNAFLLNKNRGMVVQTANGRLSNSYYIQPRLLDDGDSHPAPLPAKVLTWLLDHPESSLENPTVSLQETIYQLVSEEEYRDRYMYLDEICQQNGDPPSRAIARQCQRQRSHDHSSSSDVCCYFVVQQSEGGTIRMPTTLVESHQR